MSVYEEGIKLIDEMFGNGKDNLIALATVARELSADGKPRPVVRCVDAYYEDCTFYVVTYAKSNKMLQIEKNAEVSIAFCSEMFTANGTAENLGWVLDSKNSGIRTKLRSAFADWYEMANNENDILKVGNRALNMVVSFCFHLLQKRKGCSFGDKACFA